MGGPDDEVYCKVCYLRYHGPGGHNKFGEKTTFPCDEESPEACVRCKGQVFEAKKQVTKTGVIHKYCLACKDCNCNLDASSFFNGDDGEIYCKPCYSFEFGAKSRFRPRAGRMNRARAVPNMFANNADDILARSTVETWVIKGEKGDVDVCKKY